MGFPIGREWRIFASGVDIVKCLINNLKK